MAEPTSKQAKRSVPKIDFHTHILPAKLPDWKSVGAQTHTHTGRGRESERGKRSGRWLRERTRQQRHKGERRLQRSQVQRRRKEERERGGHKGTKGHKATTKSVVVFQAERKHCAWARQRRLCLCVRSFLFCRCGRLRGEEREREREREREKKVSGLLRPSSSFFVFACALCLFSFRRALPAAALCVPARHSRSTPSRAPVPKSVAQGGRQGHCLAPEPLSVPVAFAFFPPLAAGDARTLSASPALSAVRLSSRGCKEDGHEAAQPHSTDSDCCLPALCSPFLFLSIIAL